MATIAPIAEPGVTVIQEFTAASPATSSAVLPAAIVGPAFEIIDVLDADGVLNSDALAGSYDQFPQSILQTAFPDPRGNNAELNIQEETIKAFYYYGNLLVELDRGDGAPNGSAFLSNVNDVRRAAVESVVNDAAGAWTTDVLVGRSFVLAFDIAAEANTTKNVTVTIAGAGPAATAAEVAASINSAVGETVAQVVGAGPWTLRIFSPTWGASGNVNVRGANAVTTALFGDASARRVEGSGFRAQDDVDGDLVTPWIEFFVGQSYVAAVADAFADPACGLVDEAGVFTGSAVASVTFTGSGADIPLQAASSVRAGDQMFAEGSQVKSGEVVQVQASRFRLGVLNSLLSTFDSEGNPTNRVYTDVEVNTPLHGTPFAPRFVWFQAQGLQFGSISPTPVAAVLIGDQQGQAAQAAELQTTFATGAKTLTGLTLIISYIKDGVTQPQVTLTFTSDPANSAALQTEIITQLTNAGVNADFSVVVTDVVSPAASFLHISTTNLGDDQTITVLSTGTANATLGFVGTRTHTGKDVEFASPATQTGLQITSTMPNLVGKLLNMVVIDSRGTHTQVCLAAGITAAAADVTIADMATELNLQSNQLAWDGATQIGTFSGPATASGTLTFTTVEAGATVSFNMSETVGDPGLAAGNGWRYLGFYTAAPFECIAAAGLGAAYVAEVLTLIVADSQAGSPHAPASAALVGVTELAIVRFCNADTGVTQAGGIDVCTFFVDAATGFVGIRSIDDSGGPVTQLDVNLVAANNAAVKTGWTVPGVDDIGVTTPGANEQDAGSSDLAGNTLQWQLDSGAQTFQTTFSSDSLEDAVAAVNLVHAGNVIASIFSGDQLQLTSTLSGNASRVQVANGASAAATALGFLTATPNDDTLTAAGPSVAGAGRPNPDFYVDPQGTVQIGGQILRNSLTGLPFGSTAAALYLDFHALRLDVSPLSTAAEKLITIDDQTELASLLSPLTAENPLGLGMFFALLNSPSTPITGIGVDEVSAALPSGTVDGYARAVDELEAKDVYALVPLSAEELVHQLFTSHVTAMSQPAQRGERIVFINPDVPTRAFPTTVASGDANSTGSPNELVLDENPSAGLVAAGLNPAALAANDGVYVEITIGGVFYRYSVSVVAANLAQFRVTFSSPDNDDGFYSTTNLTSSVVDGDYVLKVRGAPLLIPGSTRTDLTATALAVANAANAYANRRVFYVFPDQVTATLDSGSVLLPGYYACAAIAGMVGQMNPSTPFSRVPLTGFTSVQGSQDTFKPSLLDQIAGGGVYILTQQGDGAPVSSRHQLSTDVSTIERRELSITKAVDFVAKYLRNILRNFIGRNNITPQFLDTLSSVVQAQLAFLGPEGLGVIANGTLNNLVQDETQPDTILVDVQLTVLYPANYIRVTIQV